MKNMITPENEFKSMRAKDYAELKCKHCSNVFKRTKKYLNQVIRRDRNANYCSKDCRINGWDIRKTCYCAYCNTEFIKKDDQIKKTSNNFCSRSCAAIYNNTHKTKGTRRSKLEAWLEAQLPTLYPDLEFHFNRKDAINSELDIYIPSLNLAFELNGIFHYEPIFGESKLDQIQNNDHRKFQACLERGIELCIIDTSSQKYFKEKSSKKYLNIITNLVNSKLESSKTDYVEVL